METGYTYYSLVKFCALIYYSINALRFSILGLMIEKDLKAFPNMGFQNNSMYFPRPHPRSRFSIHHHSFHLDLSAFPLPTFSFIRTHIIRRLFPSVFYSVASAPCFINKQLLEPFPQIKCTALFLN